MSAAEGSDEHWTILNYIGKVRIEPGSMGCGAVLVVEDRRLGDWPICSVNAPLKPQKFNMAVAKVIADIFNGKWKIKKVEK